MYITAGQQGGEVIGSIASQVPGLDPFGVTDESHAFVGKVNQKCHSENYSENFLWCKYGDELLLDLYVGSAVSWRWA